MSHQFNEIQLNKLKEFVSDPYPPANWFETPTSIAELVDFYQHVTDDLFAGKTYVIAGRLRFKNEMGKLGFGLLHSDDATLQICVKSNIVSEEHFQAWKSLDIGDWVWAKGEFFRTQRGDLTLRVAELNLYAKCIEPTPDKWNGLGDQEQRQRMRYVDLAFNDEVQKVFRTRINVIQRMRENLHIHQFVEVETPILQPIPGGATAKPFVTHHNALDTELYLRIAPELYLKRMLVGGFERVFELNRNFRNEGISTKHNPEFTMLEFYQAFADYRQAMERTRDLIQSAYEFRTEKCSVDLTGQWKTIKYVDAIAALGIENPWSLNDLSKFGHVYYAGIHPELREFNYSLPDDSVGGMQQWAFEKFVEPTLIEPTFVTHLPTEISPLARVSDEDPRVCDRFELYINGHEIANGFTELNNPIIQAARFEKQAQRRVEGDDEAMYFDDDYIKALSYGMPPAAGVGIGIDRLVMILTGQTNIREVILFPTLKVRHE